MIRHVLTAFALLSAAGLAAPGIGHAQTFKVEKFDIKGEGGTDYVAVEADTGPRVRVACQPHSPVATRRPSSLGPIVAAWFIVIKQ
jgi:hypothetical protein